ncbi:Hypothetical predicted protein, partial [Mytilus galloprovincialis]
ENCTMRAFFDFCMILICLSGFDHTDAAVKCFKSYCINNDGCRFGCFAYGCGSEHFCRVQDRRCCCDGCISD